MIVDKERILESLSLKYIESLFDSNMLIEVAVGYMVVDKKPSLWHNTVKKLGHTSTHDKDTNITTATNIHGDVVGKYDHNKDRGFIAGSSI